MSHDDAAPDSNDQQLHRLRLQLQSESTSRHNLQHLNDQQSLAMKMQSAQIDKLTRTVEQLQSQVEQQQASLVSLQRKHADEMKLARQTFEKESVLSQAAEMRRHIARWESHLQNQHKQQPIDQQHNKRSQVNAFENDASDSPKSNTKSNVVPLSRVKSATQRSTSNSDQTKSIQHDRSRTEANSAQSTREENRSNTKSTRDRSQQNAPASMTATAIDQHNSKLPPHLRTSQDEPMDSKSISSKINSNNQAVNSASTSASASASGAHQNDSASIAQSHDDEDFRSVDTSPRLSAKRRAELHIAKIKARRDERLTHELQQQAEEREAHQKALASAQKASAQRRAQLNKQREQAAHEQQQQQSENEPPPLSVTANHILHVVYRSPLRSIFKHYCVNAKRSPDDQKPTRCIELDTLFEFMQLTQMTPQFIAKQRLETTIQRHAMQFDSIRGLVWNQFLSSIFSVAQTASFQVDRHFSKSQLELARLHAALHHLSQTTTSEVLGSPIRWPRAPEDTVSLDDFFALQTKFEPQPQQSPDALPSNQAKSVHASSQSQSARTTPPHLTRTMSDSQKAKSHQRRLSNHSASVSRPIVASASRLTRRTSASGSSRTTPPQALDKAQSVSVSSHAGANAQTALSFDPESDRKRAERDRLRHIKQRQAIQEYKQQQASAKQQAGKEAEQRAQLESQLELERVRAAKRKQAADKVALAEFKQRKAEEAQRIAEAQQQAAEFEAAERKRNVALFLQLKRGDQTKSNSKSNTLTSAPAASNNSSHHPILNDSRDKLSNAPAKSIRASASVDDDSSSSDSDAGPDSELAQYVANSAWLKQSSHPKSSASPRDQSGARTQSRTPTHNFAPATSQFITSEPISTHMSAERRTQPIDPRSTDSEDEDAEEDQKQHRQETKSLSKDHDRHKTQMQAKGVTAKSRTATSPSQRSRGAAAAPKSDANVSSEAAPRLSSHLSPSSSLNSTGLMQQLRSDPSKSSRIESASKDSNPLLNLESRLKKVAIARARESSDDALVVKSEPKQPQQQQRKTDTRADSSPTHRARSPVAVPPAASHSVERVASDREEEDDTDSEGRGTEV